MDLAIMGTGTVGSSVAELAADYGHRVTGMANVASAAIDPTGIDVKAALDRQNIEGEAALGDADPDAVLDADYDALVEVTPVTLGDAQPGFGHVRAALERDRHVVLANKGPMAERFADVRDLERASEGEVRFEATVAGAIPVLSTIEDYSPATIQAARGVLNGTANFILSRMAAEGLGYDHVLAEAQDLGVAETDPAFDVEGTDAALKCVILANVLAECERTYTLDDATVEGIKSVPGSALDLASEDGRTIRLIGEVVDGEVRVGPRLVPEHSELAVTGTTNIVQLDTDNAGRLNLSGRGAGGPETASAILADVERLPN
ncbi:homoserine dehydrogenase [Halococcoides cellulosivorans]|uniref:Homoserine dehydrogenase n=1 Tax=Halococcoides cellulosivorans TaxID=1679096 RepID=A0A2R4WZ94_9EURY|nr:homoserine dehydrogenase [Halococcoides cellulosivorans]AWB26860.1 homoserine dehydrogenase [Halococcoides cellulosivorans]